MPLVEELLRRKANVNAQDAFGATPLHDCADPSIAALLLDHGADMSVKTRSGKRVWINMSTIVFNNQRTGRRLLIHLAHDISERKKSEKLTHKMLALSKQLTSLGEGSGHAEPVPGLSEQEINILRMFAEGKESDEVTGVLGISPQTLRNHLHHINQKLRTHNRLEAVMNAIQRKLI